MEIPGPAQRSHDLPGIRAAALRRGGKPFLFGNSGSVQGAGVPS
jgi:hypothetical protein